MTYTLFKERYRKDTTKALYSKAYDAYQGHRNPLEGGVTVFTLGLRFWLIPRHLHYNHILC